MFKRAGGVLLNISSLPGDFAVGDFSRRAREFAQNIAEAGFRWWQILPLSGVGLHFSPYDGVSAFAGNPLYIDPYALAEDGLLDRADAASRVYTGSPYVADYPRAGQIKSEILRLAFKNNLKDAPRLIRDFASKNEYWLDDYASYMALRGHFGGLPWPEWPPAVRLKTEPEYSALVETLSEDILFYKFEQYLFWEQWNKLRDYVNSLGIKIMGDSPIYVAYESADVFHRPEYFQLNKNKVRKKVAGVPPDYFSEGGQLWNNPLYDWKVMERDNYAWFRARVGRLLAAHDAVRIDHFRGFHAYWSVKWGSKDASKGKWKKGPGMKLFRAIAEDFPKADIVAEDLGDLGGGAREFVAETGFPGMRVLQFAFSEDGADNEHMPHNYPKNIAAYTGTHDNDTALGWLFSASETVRRDAARYCGFEGLDWTRGGRDNLSVKAMIRTLFASPSALAIVPAQDICGFGGDTRMNVPGIEDGNWAFRLAPDYTKYIDKEFFRELHATYKR